MSKQYYTIDNNVRIHSFKTHESDINTVSTPQALIERLNNVLAAHCPHYEGSVILLKNEVVTTPVRKGGEA